MTKLLFELMTEQGVSGDESRIRNIILKEIKNYVDKIQIDPLGNLIAVKKGKKPSLLLAAHMDEVGLMVKQIRDDGEIALAMIGGLEPLVLLGQKVFLITRAGKKIRGIITTKELSADHEVRKLPGLHETFIDTGLTKKELQKIGVEVGTYVAFEQEAEFLGNTNNLVVGKAADDRAGCYILIELIKKLKNIKNETYFVFTVQEEMGLYGAKTSAYQLNPDWAIAVDTTNSNEHNIEVTRKIGDGPCLTYKDAELLSSQVLDDWVMNLSKKYKIPLQPQVSDFGTTDAMSIALSKGGVPTTVLSIPVKNIHSAVSIIDLKDVENAIKLLDILIKNPPIFIKPQIIIPRKAKKKRR